MIVRVLSAWPGSPPCGTVGEVPDPVARQRIASGYAEPVAPARQREPETATPSLPEQAVAIKRGRRR